MRIFVSGATGVIGSRVVPLLTAAGHQVTAAGRTPEKRAALERSGAMAVQADLFDPEALGKAVAGHEVVINLASKVPSFSRMVLPGAWREMDRIRHTASANLVAAAIAGGVRRFIQESFAPIYADAGDQWIDETMPTQPVANNRSVLDAEAAAERFTQSGQTGVVLRFAAFYGSDPQTQMIIRSVRRGRSPFPGPGTAYYPAISHEDAARAVVAALNVPAGIYNVVDDEPLREREVFGSLAQALGVPAPKFLPAWTAGLFGTLGAASLLRSLRLSNRKLREASGWTPNYPSVREGWQALVGKAHQVA